MSYRDDLEAAHQRIHALETENATLRKGEAMPEPKRSIAPIAYTFARLLARKLKSASITAIKIVAISAAIVGVFVYVVIGMSCLEMSDQRRAADQMCQSFPVWPIWLVACLAACAGAGYVLHKTWCEAEHEVMNRS